MLSSVLKGSLTKGPKSVTALGFNTKTTSLGASYSFTYGTAAPAGSFIVVVVTARPASGTAAWTSMSDSAGNTFTEVVDGAQSNSITFTGIYFCQLTNAVTASTTITAVSAMTSASSAQHATVFRLTGVTGVDATANNPLTSNLISATATTSTGDGIAIHGISTGLSTAPSVTSVSSGFTLRRSIPFSGCSQYIATSEYNQSPSTSVSNTFTMSASGAYASVMALFK